MMVMRTWLKDLELKTIKSRQTNRLEMMKKKRLKSLTGPTLAKELMKMKKISMRKTHMLSKMMKNSLKSSSKTPSQNSMYF